MSHPFIPTHTNLTARRAELTERLHKQQRLQQCQAAGITKMALQRVTRLLLAAEIRKVNP